MAHCRDRDRHQCCGCGGNDAIGHEERPQETRFEQQGFAIEDYDDGSASTQQAVSTRVAANKPDMLMNRSLALPVVETPEPEEKRITHAPKETQGSDAPNTNTLNQEPSTQPARMNHGMFQQRDPEEQALQTAIESPLGVSVHASEGQGQSGQFPMMNQQQQLTEMLMNQLGGEHGLGGLTGMMGDMDPSHMMGGMFGESYKGQNQQGDKMKFVAQGKQGEGDGYLSSKAQYPRSPYEVKAGSVIPISLVTAINSDLPGDVIAQVRENVYDSITGQHLLIPHGTKVMAKYDSMIAYGQNRVLVCWNRMIRPDGVSLDLQCSPGVDLAGQAGYADDVDNHWGRIVGGILLSSTLAASVTRSQGDGSDGSFDEQFAANVGDEINGVGQQITKKNINIQPTIKVRPGFSLNILVNRDFILPVYR